jgi:hypothetical protein
MKRGRIRNLQSITRDLACFAAHGAIGDSQGDCTERGKAGSEHVNKDQIGKTRVTDDKHKQDTRIRNRD